MKKRCLLLTPVLLLSLVLTACSAGSTGGDHAAKTEPFSPGAVTENSGSQDYLVGAPSAAPTTAPDVAPTPAPGGGESGGPSAYELANVKLIFRASVSLQTTEFDAAKSALEKLVDEQGGYCERAEARQGSYYDKSASRSASYVVRVPQENFETFLTAAGGVGHVVSIDKSSEDVGQQYFDAESRVKTLQIQRSRLQALLEKAETMDNIISLERALADVEYQIEQYGTELRRYDSLISYSTVNLTLDEVLEITEQPKETVSLGGRIANAFRSGMYSFGRGLGNFAVWLAYNLLGVVIFLVLLAVAVTVLVRVRRKRRLAQAALSAKAAVPEESQIEEERQDT